jgi:ABC-type sugar transport system ATPase subunit
MTAAGTDLVDLVGIAKSFAGREVLRDITMTLRSGAVHAFVGENGAGKSTLARVLAGVIRPDRGETRIDGEMVRMTSPRQARQRGIALVSQELALVPKRSVLENVLAGQLPTWGPGLVSRPAMCRSWDTLLDRSGLDLPADKLVGQLSAVQQQQVEILRAMAANARLLILDEPTTMMSRDQADKIMSLVRRLADAGTGVMLISHALEDVLAVSDEVTVLRDGILVRSSPAERLTRDSLITDMIGGQLGGQYPDKQPPASEAPVLLRASGVRRGWAVRGVDLTVRAGEIVGIAGLVGSGRSKLIRCLAGADRRDGGSIEVDGMPRRLANVRQARQLGIVMIPEDRKLQGLHLDHSIERNITLPYLAGLSRAGLMQRSLSASVTQQGLASVQVQAPSARSPVRYLSGGNQQRVLFAKWLVGKPRVILADEPTRGVDIAGKRAIYDLLTSLASGGAGIIVVSSELSEVIGLSHRVLVMRHGRVTAELAGSQITEQSVISAAFGESGQSRGGE